jgi:DNA-binding MarR family transcriptional regulator
MAARKTAKTPKTKKATPRPTARKASAKKAAPKAAAPKAAPPRPTPKTEEEAFRMASRDIYREMGRLGRAQQGVLDLPSVEMNLLMALLYQNQAGNDSVAASDLVAGEDMDKGAVSRALTRLEKRGFVGRKQDKDDARRQTIVMKPGGRRQAERLDKMANDWVRGKFSAMAPKDRKALMAGMEMLAAMYDGAADGFGSKPKKVARKKG